MQLKHLYQALFTTMLGATLTACGGGSGGNETTGDNGGKIDNSNKAPVITQITPYTIKERDQLTINAQASDEDGSIAAYLWQQTSGTQVTLESSDTSELSFVAPSLIEPETLTFKLTVTDDKGKSTSAEVTVDVETYSEIDTLVSTFSSSGLQDCLKALPDADAGIKSLTCEGQTISSFDGIEGLVNLESLKIKNAQIGNLLALTKINKLTTLHFEDVNFSSNLSSGQISTLTALSQLKSLSLVTTDSNYNYYNVKNIDFSHFIELESLTIDVHSYYGRTEVKLEGINKNTLKHLSLGLVNLVDEQVLSGLANLKSLDLRAVHGLSSLNFLKDMPVLESLSLRYIIDIDSAALEAKTNLTKLVLEGTRMENFSFLDQFTSLEYLKINSRYTSSTIDFATTQLPATIKELSLSHLNVENSTYLANLTDLSSLTLSDMKLSSIAFIKDYTELNFLHLSNLEKLIDINWLQFTPAITNLYISKIGADADLSSIDNLSKLQKFHLVDSTWSITNRDFSFLEGKPLQALTLDIHTLESSNLPRLDSLVSLNIQAEAVNGLMPLDLYPALNELTVSHTSYYGAKITSLDGLGNNANVQKLTLKGFSKVEDISQLANLPNLTDLIIEGSSADDISALNSLDKIERLSLLHFNNFFRANTLVDLPSLKTLEISGNGIFCEDIPLLNNLQDVEVKIDSYSCVKNPINWSLIEDSGLAQCIKSKAIDTQEIHYLNCDEEIINSVAGIEQFTQLDSVILNAGGELKILGEPYLKQLPRLQSIELQKFTGTVPSNIQWPTNLTNLRITFASEPLDLAKLQAPTSLTTLYFNYTKLVNYPLLSKYTSLETLGLNDTGITTLKPLYNLKNLESLSIQSNPNIPCEEREEIKNQLTQTYFYGLYTYQCN
ncbi:PKD domain-containing protein (plasmid) [Pseudoalteromonas sp. T1lg65]|uniref:PKD domain-containing protein n=1 Tax=Pseudoalteromonas sp. T1lg65 TaxID=2077101 RepID=UPI003F7A630A